MKIQISYGFMNFILSSGGHGMNGKGRSFGWGMEW